MTHGRKQLCDIFKSPERPMTQERAVMIDSSRAGLVRAIPTFLALLCGLIPFGCKKADPAPPLVCHVGGTMRPIMQQLVKAYEAETGRKVEINSGGSGEMLAHIEGQKTGDLYICHDPFLDILMKKFRMGADGWTVAELTPVIIVQKGNPKNIRGLADLTRPDVALFLTDYDRSTLGHMVATIFRRAGIDFEKLKSQKKIPTHRSGSHVANLVKMKNADAALVWNVVAKLRAEALDVVPIGPEHLPRPQVDALTSATGKEYFLTPVRVTIATLTCSRQPEAAGEFARFVASERAAEIFRAAGFTMNPVRKEYENGKKL